MACLQSVVIPVYNGAKWLDETFSSVLHQSFSGSLEVSVFNDASTDSTAEMLKTWQRKFEAGNIKMVISGHVNHPPKGVGYGRNRAIEQSKGEYLCFMDADDVMSLDRIKTQYAATIASKDKNLLIGSNFVRIPEDSTARYTVWYNSLSRPQLLTQAFTAFGPTIIQPTWFCSRQLFDHIGNFSEEGKGTPEDLIFFYKHLAQGGKLLKVEKSLLMYRYHPDCETFAVKRETIWELRVEALQTHILSKWSHFTIWNAGKQGRRLYRSLTPENQAKVLALCDVDQKKIEQGVYTYQESKVMPKPQVPIIHFSAAEPPFILCVKVDLTGGEFEKNLASLQLVEGQDYYHFS